MTGGTAAGAIALSIVVPTHDTRDLTTACLCAILAHPPSRPFEILLIDNASTDGTLDHVLQHVKAPPATLRVVRNAWNAGYARACNQGARLARGQTLLFLNSDTEPEPHAFDRLLATLDAAPRTAIVGPLLVAPGGRRILQMSWGRDPILWGEACNRFLSPRALGRSGWRRARAARLQRRRRAVDAVSGACLLVRRSAFEAIGGFDEAFEFYFEDSDLCRRCRLAGWLVELVPQARLRHGLGRSTAGGWTLPAVLYRQSQIRFYRRHAPRWALPLLHAFLAAKWLRLALVAAVTRDAALRAHLRRFAAVLAGRQRFTLEGPTS